MKIEVVNDIRVITPTDGKLLCNMTDKVISDKVYLGVNADETVWTEIEESERESLETKWYEEIDGNEATETDYINALGEMGVDLNE